MDSLSISADLIRWAECALYSFSVASPDGALIFWTAGGEDRIYLRPGAGRRDWLAATEASRSGDESFLFAAVSIYVAERYLWGFFGTIFRDKERVPRLRIPINLKAVADPYRIEADDGGHVLFEGSTPIMRAGRSSMDVAILVRTSYWLRVTVEELEHAYRDPGCRLLCPLGE
jgi:hypothetical protein